MKKRFMQKDGKRLKFLIRVPKELWDHLPKIISRKVETEIPDIEKRCVACGLRLKALFSRAIKGMVGRATLGELVNEICNDELYSPSPSPKTMEIRQMILQLEKRHSLFDLRFNKGNI